MFGMPPLVLDVDKMLELVFVNPSWLAKAENEMVIVTVTTGEEVVGGFISIEMFPFLLNEQKIIEVLESNK